MLRGLVKDSVSGVHLALLDSTGLVVYETYTEQHGRYDFGSVRPGTYTVRPAKEDYQPIDRPGVLVKPNTITFLDFRITRQGLKPRKNKRRDRRN